MPLQTSDLSPPAPHTLQLLRQTTNVVPEDSSPQIHPGQFGFTAEMDSRPFYKVRGCSRVQGPLSCYRTNKSFLCRMHSGSPAKLPLGTELVMLRSGEWIYNICQKSRSREPSQTAGDLTVPERGSRSGKFMTLEHLFSSLSSTTSHLSSLVDLWACFLIYKMGRLPSQHICGRLKHQSP